MTAAVQRTSTEAPGGAAVLRRRPGHVLGVGALSVVACALYATYAVSRLVHFRAATYDLVIFDQAVRSYARFQPGIAPVKGVHNGFGPHFSVLGDHFSPILALLVPAYWLHDGPVTLVVAQAVLFAAAVPFVWVFARRALGPAAAYLVAGAFAFSWELQAAVAFDFHEVAFAVPLAAIALERFQAQRYGQATIAASALLLVKEDMGFFLAGFGVLLLTRRRWWHGITLVLGGIGAVLLTTQVLMPAAGGRPGYYWQYGSLGPAPAAGLRHIVEHPLDTLMLLVSPDTKWHTLLWLFAPLLFCSVLSPYVLPALPLIVERMLAGNPNWWTTWPHYNAFVVPVLFCAGIDGAARVARWAGGGSSRVRAVRLGWAGAVSVATLVAIPHFPLHNLTHHSWWIWSQRQQAMQQVVAAVPDGVTVEAPNRFGPALTARTTVLLLDRRPRGAPWVIYDGTGRGFPFRTWAEQRRRLPWLLAHGYHVVESRGGFTLLHRDG